MSEMTNLVRSIRLYELIVLKKNINGTCPVCNKKNSKVFEIEYTVNNESTWSSLREFAEQEMANWKPDFTHIKCSLKDFRV